LTLFAILWVSAGYRALAQDKVERLPLTTQEIEELKGIDWYGVYMLGKKVGYAKFTLARGDEGKEAPYVMAMEAQMNFVAAGAKQSIQFVQTCEFEREAPFAFRKGMSSEVSGNSSKKTELMRQDNGFEAVQTVDGNTKKKQLGQLDYTLTDELMPRLWVRRGPKAGAGLKSQTYDMEKLQLDPETRKLLSTKTSLVEGVKVTFHEVEMTSAKIGVPTLERYNSAGKVLSFVLGGVIELRAESEQLAKNIEISTDLFLLGTVKADRSLGEASRIESLILEVAGQPGAALKSGPRQTVSATESGTLLCKLGKEYGTAVKATDKEIEDNLAETDIYPITNEKVVALAKKAVGEAKTPREKVDRLVSFVAKYIAGDYNVRPRNLLQLLELRKGACTEYALLFTTLARAAGIPAREVTGLYYIGDDAKAFGPHAWNEVVLDGRWVPIDATWNETEINATHISFGSNQTDHDLTVLAKFLATFGKLTFKVVEVKKK
jgi:hypothetical protein